MGLYHLKTSLTYFASHSAAFLRPLCLTHQTHNCSGQTKDGERSMRGEWVYLMSTWGLNLQKPLWRWEEPVCICMSRLVCHCRSLHTTGRCTNGCYSGKWNEYECIREDIPTGVLLRWCHPLSLFSFNCYCHCESGTPELYLNNMKTSTHPPSIHCGTFVWL